MKHLVIAVTVLCVFLAAGSVSLWAQDRSVGGSDFDGSGVVDFLDFLAFAQAFGEASGDPGFEARFDLSGNGTVDFDDFLIFLGNYGKSTAAPVHTFLYIADLLGGKISVVDTETNLIDPLLTIEVSQPRGIAFSPTDRRIYVAGVDTFYALTGSGARDYAIPLVDPPAEPDGPPSARGGFKLVVSQDATHAFVTEESADQVEVIDLAQKVSAARIPVGPRPVGIAIAPDGEEVYVANVGRSLTVIDAQRHAYKDSIEVGEIAARRLAIAPDGAHVYTARLFASEPSGDNSVLQLIGVDLTEGTVSKAVEIGNPTDLSTQVVDLALSEDGAFLYATIQRVVPVSTVPDIVSFQLQGSLLVVDEEKFQIVEEVVVGEQVGALGVAPDGKTAYVGVVVSITQDPNLKVFIVDLSAGAKVVGTLLGFDIPVEFKFRAGKAAVPDLPLLEIAVLR